MAATNAQKLVSISVHSWLQRARDGWKPSISGYERKGSRGPARAAELSRRLANRMAYILPLYCLVNPARFAAGDFAFCARVSCRNGPKPNRGLAAQTSRPSFRQCDTADACADRSHHHDHRVCDSAVDHPNAGIVAERTQTRARPSNPNRIADAKLSGSSRGV